MVALAGTLGATVAGAAGPSAVRVLSPTLFPGWQTRNVADPVVVRDPVRGLRMFYSGSATEQRSDAAWDLWATGAATSGDGRRWTWVDGGYEPVLVGHLFHEGEVVDASVRSAAFDFLEARAGSVRREGARWWMWYTGWNGDDRAMGRGRSEKVHFRIGAAVSADAVRWTKRPGPSEAGAVLGLGPAGSLDAMAAGSPAVIRDGPSLRMWYEAYDGTTWRIAEATSTDGLAWTKAGVALEPGRAGALDERGARHPVVVALARGYELWFQGRSASVPPFHVLRARSADGRRWRKLEGEVVLHPDPPATAEEEVRVGSVLARPDGARDVYFAKETTAARTLAFGTVSRRTTAVYAEVVPARE